jgi:hypothetical protein
MSRSSHDFDKGRVELVANRAARYFDAMVKKAGSETVKPQKRGPAPTGKGFPVTVRLQPDELATLDLWIAAHAPDITRVEAIRRILQMAAIQVPKPPTDEGWMASFDQVDGEPNTG